MLRMIDMPLEQIKDIINGKISMEEAAAKHPSVFAYERTYENENLVVVCNFYKNEVVWDSKMDLSQYEVLLSNYSEQNIENGKITLKPYEAVMLYRK